MIEAASCDHGHYYLLSACLLLNSPLDGPAVVWSYFDRPLQGNHHSAAALFALRHTWRKIPWNK